MDNSLQAFHHDEFGDIRCVEFEGNPWLVGKDVATALGYVNPRKALDDHVDVEDKQRGDDVTIRDSIGRVQHPTIINESGLYSLVLSSKLPGAKRFKRWVTHDVLPSIRKHGLYAIDEILDNPDIAIEALQRLKEERAKRKALQETVAIQTQQIAEMQPKVTYYDIVLQCKDLLPITTIAKDYGWSGKKMNKWLREQGIQFKQGDIWLLYQKYAKQGWTNTKTHLFQDENGDEHTSVKTYWTQKGRLAIYELMKAEGNLPLIEQHEQ